VFDDHSGKSGASGATELDPADERWLLRPEEVAQRLNLSRSTIYVLLHGDLPSIRIGRSRRIPASALREWLNRQRG
jgi:excisionase family DNA binding protein